MADYRKVSDWLLAELIEDARKEIEKGKSDKRIEEA